MAEPAANPEQQQEEEPEYIEYKFTPEPVHVPTTPEEIEAAKQAEQQRLLLVEKNMPNVIKWKSQIKGTTLELENDDTVTNLHGIEQAGNIEVLILKQCKNVTLDGIQKLETLKELTVQGCDLKSLEPLKRNKTLEKLDVAGNKISELKPIEEITTLKHVDVSNNMITASTELFWLYLCTQLLSFKCFGNEMTKDPDFVDRICYAISETCEDCWAKEAKNEIEQYKPMMLPIKSGLSPFEIWMLQIAVEKVEKENAELEAEKARLEKENKELDEEAIRLQKEIDEISAKVKATFPNQELDIQ